MTLDETVTALRAALDRRDMRTWVFARRMGVSPETVSRWASGSQSMSTDAVVRAARILRAPELLLDHPVGRALAEMRAAPVVDLAAVRALLKAEPILLRALRYADGRVEVVDEAPIRWLPDETPPPAAPVAVAA